MRWLVNHIRSRSRARGEHAFPVIKRLLVRFVDSLRAANARMFRHSFGGQSASRVPEMRRSSQGQVVCESSVFRMIHMPYTYFRGSGALLFVLAAVQVTLVSHTFPATEVLSTKPLLTIDAAYHWYQIAVAEDLAVEGRLTGYDPTFGGGSIGGIVMNASAKVPALVAVLLRPYLDEAQAYKVYVFLAALLGPLCVPLACRISGVRMRGAVVAALFGLLLWWASAFRWYHTAGMVSFVLACYVSLPFAALFSHATHAPRKWPVVTVAGLIGAFGLLLHPLFPILALFAISAGGFQLGLSAEWPRLLKFGAAVSALSLLPNWPWISALLRVGAGEIGSQPFQQRVDLVMWFRELLAEWDDGAMGSKLYAGLFAATLVGALGQSASQIRTLSRAALATSLVASLFAWGGAAIPGVGVLQPNRFAVYAYLLLAIPAGRAIAGVMECWRTSGRPQQLVAVPLLAIAVTSLGYATWELSREISYRPTGHFGSLPPEVRGVGPRSAWLIEELRKRTTAEGRVLFETSVGRVFDNAHSAGYIARSASREFIGGPYPFMFEAGFWDGFAFGRSLNSMPEDEIRRDLDAFNIGWVVVQSSTARKFFSTKAWAVPISKFDGIEIYKVNRSLSFFWLGAGRVSLRETNKLVLTDLSGSSVVLKYVYVPGLTAKPSGTVRPFYVQGVRQPFIAVSSIANGYVELSLD